jgi:hypothetical protein
VPHPPHPRTADLEALLLALQRGGVAFIVVGGAAAVIHGAPVSTQDLDIVPRQHEGDAARLLAVLGDLEARFRPVLPGRDLPPTEQHVRGAGQLNLTTRLGPLDVLCRLHDARGYDELLPHTREIVDGELALRLIDLETLIEIKEAAGRPKDRLVVEILRALRRPA